jgi:hypothetical protein
MFSGCNQQNHISTKQKSNIKQQFPSYLVGMWKGEDKDTSLWEFTFEQDGKISKLTNFLGLQVNVSEGQADRKIPELNIDQACTLGPVEVNYEPDSRTLSVKVVTDYYMFYVAEQMIEGSSVDTFTGPISEDGSTWDAEWRSFSGTSNGPPIDFNNPVIVKVAFYKEKSNQ